MYISPGPPTMLAAASCIYLPRARDAWPRQSPSTDGQELDQSRQPSQLATWNHPHSGSVL